MNNKQLLNNLLIAATNTTNKDYIKVMRILTNLATNLNLSKEFNQLNNTLQGDEQLSYKDIELTIQELNKLLCITESELEELNYILNLNEY